MEALPKALAAQYGNWLERRIAGLGGRFAGILLAETEGRALKGALAALESEGLRITNRTSMVRCFAALSPRLILPARIL